jgi:hypothetical protein
MLSVIEGGSMIIPVVPDSVPCATCGDMATVVKSRSRQGEQLVLARIAGKLYVAIDCQICGSVQQEVETPKTPLEVRPQAT